MITRTGVVTGCVLVDGCETLLKGLEDAEKSAEVFLPAELIFPLLYVVGSFPILYMVDFRLGL